MLHHARLETPGPEPPLEPVPTEPSPTPTPEPTPASIPHVPTPFPPTLDLGPPVEPTRPRPPIIIESDEILASTRRSQPYASWHPWLPRCGLPQRRGRKAPAPSCGMRPVTMAVTSPSYGTAMREAGDA